MSLRFFTIPIHDSEVSEQELNQFLASHRADICQEEKRRKGTGIFSLASKKS
jgi:hypothetical protein